MIMQQKSIDIELLEVLSGKKTTLVCTRKDIPQRGNLKVIDSNGNIRTDQYSVSMPKQCFSTKNIMFLNVNDQFISMDSKLEIIDI